MKYIARISLYGAAAYSAFAYPMLANAQQSALLQTISTPLGNFYMPTLILAFFGIMLFTWIVTAALLYFTVFKKTKAFSREQALSSGWRFVQKHLWFFVAIIIIQNIAGIIPNFAGFFLGRALRIPPNNPYFNVGIIIIDVALSLLMTIGIMKIAITLIDSGRVKVIDLFIHVRYFLSFLAATVLYALAVIIGFILFIVPGFIVAAAFLLYPFFIIDKNLGPIKALQASMQATKGARFDLILMVILFIEINIVGTLAALVGLFVTVPLTVLAFAHIYRALASRVA